MARRKPRPTIREENERALLEAAERVFAEQGFAGATTAAIAQRAGVPKANLHYYFPTKQGLYRAVIGRVLTAWLAAAPCFDASDDPAVALSSYIGAKMDLAREMPLATVVSRKSWIIGADRMGRVARARGPPLDRSRQAQADRAEIPILHDLGDDPAIRQRSA
jgi:TetR/AcrR family transcriptional regulator